MRMRVYLVPSFHYDNTWHMSSKYYADFTKERIIKKAVSILKAEEDFCFTIDHLPSLESFLEEYPEDGNYLRTQIREGRVEAVGPMYTQSDCLTIGGESIVRQCLYGAKWLQSSLGVKPTIEWLTDVYGYCNQLPQILKKSGVNFLVISTWWVRVYKEGREYLSQFPLPWDFMWEGIDGSRMVTHDSTEYQGLLLPGDKYILGAPTCYPGKGHDRAKKRNLIISSNAFNKSKEAFLEKYEEIKQKHSPYQESLFMHMGGDFREPDGRNIHLIRKLKKETDLPEIILSTPAQYFRTIKKTYLPVIKGEINPIYKGRFGEGYYETKAWIKQLNRKFEYKMAAAELLASMACIIKVDYPAKVIECAYKPVLFYQHHDPFIGCIPKEEYDLLVEKFRSSISQAEDIIRCSTENLVRHIETKDQGTPLVVFNPSSWPRSDIIEASVEFPQGNTDIVVQNSKQEALPAQVNILERYPDGSSKRAELKILAREIPACGYEVFYIDKAEKRAFCEKELSVRREAGSFSIENKFYRTRINSKGQLESLYDRQTGKEFIGTDTFLANEFIVEEDLGCFCYIKTTGKTWPEKAGEELRLAEKTSFFLKLTAKTKIKDITIKKNIVFYAFRERIDFQANVCLPNGEDKRLRVIFPLNFEKEEVVVETPFGYANRKGGISSMINWLEYKRDEKSLTIFNRGIPSYEVKANNIYLNLIKGLSLEDPMGGCLPPFLRKKMIEKGRFQFYYGILAHGRELSVAEIVKMGYEFNVPLLAKSSSSHAGTLPTKYGFFSLKPKNLLISTVKRSEKGDALVLRIYETQGNPETIANLVTPLSVESGFLCNLLEVEERALKIESHKVEFVVKRHEIITLKLYLT